MRSRLSLQLPLPVAAGPSRARTDGMSPELSSLSYHAFQICQEVSRHHFPVLHRNPLPVFDGTHVPNVTSEKYASKLGRTKLCLSRTSIFSWGYQRPGSRRVLPFLISLSKISQGHTKSKILASSLSTSTNSTQERPVSHPPRSPGFSKRVSLLTLGRLSCESAVMPMTICVLLKEFPAMKG